MEEIKEEFGPNIAFHCKLNVRDERVIAFFKENCKAARFCYNYARRRHAEEYKIWNAVREEERKRLKELITNEEEFDKKYSKFCSDNKKNYITDFRKVRDEITAKKNAGEKGFAWLKEANATACGNAIYFDYKSALKKFNETDYEEKKKDVERKRKKCIENKNFKKLETLIYPFAYNFPRSKKSCDSNSFHLDNIKIHQINFKENKIYIPGLSKWVKNKYDEKHNGYVKIWHNRRLPKLHEKTKELSIPTISTDGRDWYLSVGYYKPLEQLTLTDTVLGVDLGLKESIITSDGRHYPNPANNRRYLKLRRRLHYLQRALSKNLEKSPLTKDLPAKERWKDENKSCKAKRLEKAIKITQIKIKDMFDCQRKQMVAELLKDNPSVVVLEKMNTKGMQQTKKMAPKLQESAMYKIKTYIVEACKRRGIEAFDITQNKNFASTQLCSNCGYKNTDMAGQKNLNKRVFKCPQCGTIIDRDENAAINLRDAVIKHPEKLNRLT